PAFASTARVSLDQFNRYAREGNDPEFERGRFIYDTQWHKLFSAKRAGTAFPDNPYPNLTMHPMAPKGPYYCFILAAGALDTSGGPRINQHAQILAADGNPIPGLYGAGNCIAAPS
ncbi:FAD-binding protein, partial [Klebsiella pneumoniae]|uniref:FAD-binding protein n=1 Tax=Klebsiella pneumoniae TaxID=573 RepID=UPI001C5E758F